MARHLAIVHRTISADARAEYLGAVETRKAAADHAAAHFWIFEHVGDAGKYVEFVEGGDAATVAALAGVTESALWRAVEQP